MYLVPRYLFTGLAFLILFSYATSAHAQRGRTSCEAKDLPQVVVNLTSSPIRYDFTLSKSRLQNFNIDTLSPYDQNAHTEVGGLMNGEISVSTNVAFGWSTNRQTRDACFWYEQIDVKMHVAPTIYIASEHPEGSCMHKAVMEHEMKHVAVDRRILQQYRDLVRTDLERVIRRVGTIGPTADSNSDQVRKRMMAIIERTVSGRTEKMYAERRVRRFFRASNVALTIL